MQASHNAFLHRACQPSRPRCDTYKFSYIYQPSPCTQCHPDVLVTSQSSSHARRLRRTENCVVVAEGELGHNGVFKVHALGFPPVEARAKSLAVAKARSAPNSTGCANVSHRTCRADDKLGAGTQSCLLVRHT